MKLSETDDIKAGIEKRERVDFIEIHDRDYIRNNPTLDRLKDELGSRSFDVTLYNALDSDYTCIICRISYYLHESCISQELKRFLKKYRNYKNANGLMRHDDTQNPNSYLSYLKSSTYHKKKWGYMPNNKKSDDIYTLRDKVYRELKNYIQYHPLFLQVVGDVEEYEVSQFEYFTELI